MMAAPSYDTLRRDNERLRDILSKCISRTRHDSDCDIHDTEFCTCGLREFLLRARDASNPMTPEIPDEQKQVLARALKRWQESPTQGVFARTKDGAGTSSRHPDAVSWCMLGALRKEGLTHAHADQAIKAFSDLLVERYSRDIMMINDSSTHEHANEMFTSTLKEMGAIQ